MMHADIATPAPIQSRPVSHPPLDQAMGDGTFATMTRVPFTQPHRIYVGTHLGSFPSQQAAIDAARTLSAGDEPGVLVTSHTPWTEFELTPNDRFVEDSNFNVYQALDVKGPLVENPVIGWKSWNTETRPYRHGEPWGVFQVKGWRSTDLMPQVKDAVLVDGADTVEIATSSH